MIIRLLKMTIIYFCLIKSLYIFAASNITSQEIETCALDIDNECLICMEDTNAIILDCCKKNICRKCLNSWTLQMNSKESKRLGTNYSDFWKISSISCPHCRSNISIASIYWPNEIKKILITINSWNPQTAIIHALDLETLLMVYSKKSLCNLLNDHKSEDILFMLESFFIENNLANIKKQPQVKSRLRRKYCIIM